MRDDLLSHRETIGRYTVSIYCDNDRRLSDAVNDEPVMIFSRDRGRDWQVLDNSKRNFPPFATLRAIESGDINDVLSELCDCRYNDWGATENGRVFAEHSDWTNARNQNGRRYFRTKESAAAALFQAEHGRALADLKVEQFGDYRDTFYLCFWQSELDDYAGVKNAKPCLADCQSIVDGEVYGFVIGDDEDDHIDSCWGFIGEEIYCLDEARAIARAMESEAAELDAQAMAQDIAAARPDLAPVYAVA
jgi:hypothetical protein